jgi:hypothetical protein
MRLIPAALIFLAAAPAWAQDWTVVSKTEDGFRANFPGQPKVEAITYNTEFNIPLRARIYRAADAMGRYSTTVVDYRDAQRLHTERATKCLAAKGANQQDGDACQNDFMTDMAGATDHAAWNYIRRDGVKVTQYGLYNVDRVSGRLIQLTNPDRSRTYASMHQHAGRLYIHEATVPNGMPEPILFMQGLAWVNDKGLAIRYATLYTEGYAADWKYPLTTPPPHTLRDLDESIDQPARPSR